MVIVNPSFLYPRRLDYFFHSGGFCFIGVEINSLFRNDGSKQAWRNTCYSAIKENYEDYISILKGAIQYCIDNFEGERKKEIKAGMDIPLYSLSGMVTLGTLPLIDSESRKVIKVSKLWKYVIIQDVKEKVKLDLLKEAFDLDCVVQQTIEEIANTDQGLWEELSNRLAEPVKEEEKDISKWLKASGVASEWKV